QALAAVAGRLGMLDTALARWRALRQQDVDRLNQRLRSGGLTPISIRVEREPDDPDRPAAEEEDEP
ncbi:MAG TPA: hypothetical protein VGO40_21775, partial [Longimicrobium sp.]|nr:hypothetical protein [Longimicrobium sp.]